MKFPYGLLLLLLCISCDSCDDAELFFVCPETCYDHPNYGPGVYLQGACKIGTPRCEAGEVVECVGAVYSTPEICDGVDNDCDGQVDEDLHRPSTHEENDCLQCGPCRATSQSCLVGNWICNYRTGYPTPSDSTCDGRDNDCDCEVDEDVYPEGELVFCYTGDPSTVVHGECRPGVESCVEGHTICVGEVLPTPETCDEIDNDCNGLIDDVSSVYSEVDIIFGVDVSGSMSSAIDAVTEVICDYAATTETSADYTYSLGLVSIADPDSSYSLTQDLTDAQTLCNTLQNIELAGGIEPTLSAADAVVDPANPLGISWREGSKRIFIGFSDEPAVAKCGIVTAQWGPCYESVMLSSTTQCIETQTSVYWFITGPLGYEVQASACGGETFWLAPSKEQMLDGLNTVIQDVCLESEF